jgi:NTE family protein
MAADRRRAAGPRATQSSTPKPANDAAAAVKRINLAFQGGGSHGAFTWGVMDRLLEEPWLEYDGISGTSAGAMNAAVLACGWVRGGREGAREALDRFWNKIADSAKNSPLKPSLLDRMTNPFRLDYSPGYFVFDMLSRLFSPYELNPTGFNPLREVLEGEVDFELLRHPSCIPLFISATNVRSGKVKVFAKEELCVDAILASACLPFMFHAIEVEGEHYWDGGYMGNPALFPLIYASPSKDIMIVQINPLRRDKLPTTAREIMERVNEISFNSSLMREMRAVHFVTRLIDMGQLSGEQYKKLNIHIVESQEEMVGLGASTKLNADIEFLLHLKNIGRRTADEWLARHKDAINVHSTCDLVSTFF